MNKLCLMINLLLFSTFSYASDGLIHLGCNGVASETYGNESFKLELLESKNSDGKPQFFLQIGTSSGKYNYQETVQTHSRWVIVKDQNMFHLDQNYGRTSFFIEVKKDPSKENASMNYSGAFHFLRVVTKEKGVSELYIFGAAKMECFVD